jgi:hypothetical protein
MGVSDETDAGRSDLALHLPPLLEAAGLDAVQLDVLTRHESFRGGTVSAEAQLLTGPAREEHRRRHFGFWEYVLSQVSEVDQGTRRGLIQGALRHNSAETIQTQMNLDDFTTALGSDAFTGLPPRLIVSLTSIVPHRSGADDAWHLPMLDLGLPASSESQVACTDAINALGVGGLLFQSGRSYHFVGDKPLSDAEMTAYLARAQLLSPIVDARWASHQLIDGQCGLRISTDIERGLAPHRLVARLERR